MPEETMTVNSYQNWEENRGCKLRQTAQKLTIFILILPLNMNEYLNM